MKRVFIKILFVIISLVIVIFVFGVILAFLPTKFNSVGILPEEAAHLRENYIDTHQQFITTDGETLFLRIWNPDSINAAKKDIAVLIFPGFTAYSGAYKMAGGPISEGGYMTFGLDYRGHGLSDGVRGDSPNKERWIADLAESVKYLKNLGFKKVIVLGHSLGVAAAICATNAIPAEISGLILLSGAYEGKENQTELFTFFQKIKIFASSILRPSYPVVEYYREGMTGSNDPLFNFRYTLRYITMLDVKQLRLPDTLNIPVLVGVGDKDEIFDVDNVRDFYYAVPGNKKEFLIMKDATHAEIPVESWKEVVGWLDRNF